MNYFTCGPTHGHDCIIFSSILLISNSIYVFTQIPRETTLVSFSKTSYCTRPSDSCNFDRI